MGRNKRPTKKAVRDYNLKDQSRRCDIGDQPERDLDLTEVSDRSKAHNSYWNYISTRPISDLTYDTGTSSTTTAGGGSSAASKNRSERRKRSRILDLLPESAAQRRLMLGIVRRKESTPSQSEQTKSEEGGERLEEEMSTDRHKAESEDGRDGSTESEILSSDDGDQGVEEEEDYESDDWDGRSILSVLREALDSVILGGTEQSECSNTHEAGRS